MRSPEEFIQLVQQMRNAQNEYFASRALRARSGVDAMSIESRIKHLLIESKKLESQVDQEIKDFYSPKLF